MSENIEQKCLAKGVKLTEQRKIIAKIMSESNDHPDVDELYNRVSKIDYYCFSFDDFNESETNKYVDVPQLCKKYKIKKNLINPIYLS